jgi:hypothetical protein
VNTDITDFSIQDSSIELLDPYKSVLSVLSVVKGWKLSTLALHKKANLTTDDTDLRLRNGPDWPFLISVNQCYQCYLR